MVSSYSPYREPADKDPIPEVDVSVAEITFYFDNPNCSYTEIIIAKAYPGYSYQKIEDYMDIELRNLGEINLRPKHHVTGHIENIDNLVENFIKTVNQQRFFKTSENKYINLSLAPYFYIKYSTRKVKMQKEPQVHEYFRQGRYTISDINYSLERTK